MRLTAISAGYAIPRTNFDATIHSVFRTAVNLKPAHSDLLITLVVAGEADLPQGIRLDSPVDFSFEHLRVGGNVFCRDGSLIFEDSALAIEFNHCQRWQCDLPALATDLAKPAVAEAWKCVWHLLNECQVRRGAEIVAEALLNLDKIEQPGISSRVGEAIHRLNEAARSYKVTDHSSLKSLIGLGTGLTPCGDDILIGYLAGLWCTVRDSKKRRRFVSDLGRAVIHFSERTNDISRTYLRYAALGQVSSRLDVLARAISKPESLAQILPVAETAMHSGHTSGMDTVTGLLLGFAAWEGDTILALS